MSLPMPMLGCNSTSAIRVSNLPREAAEVSWLRIVFSSFGAIEDINIVTSSPGSAIIRFNTPEQASSALKLDGSFIFGVTLKVQLEPQLATTGVDSSPGIVLSPIVHPSTVHAFKPFTPVKGPITYDELRMPFQALSSPNGSSFNTSLQRQSCKAANFSNDTAPVHKNLYVLNLPLDATTDQLAALFNAHGAVVHCVILAMLDAQARRRGFIDMATPQEAKEAIESLNGYVWNGYPIEVSYAIVQRSGGPLTGPDVVRRTVPRSRWNCGPRRQPLPDELSPTKSGSMRHPSSDMLHSQSDQGQVALLPPNVSSRMTHRPHNPSVCIDPYTIFITGLDPAAILDEEDLSNCLKIYGTVVACSLSRDEHGVSLGYGVVTFASPNEASAAREALDGQYQNGARLSCKNLHFTRSPVTGLNHMSAYQPGDFVQDASFGPVPNYLGVNPDYTLADTVSPLATQSYLYGQNEYSPGSISPIIQAHAHPPAYNKSVSPEAALRPAPPLLSLVGGLPSPSDKISGSTQSTPAALGVIGSGAFSSPIDISSSAREADATFFSNDKIGYTGDGHGVWGKPAVDRGPRKLQPAEPRLSFGPIGSSPGKGNSPDSSDSRRSSSVTDHSSTGRSSFSLSGNGTDDVGSGHSSTTFGLDQLFLSPPVSQESNTA